LSSGQPVFSTTLPDLCMRFARNVPAGVRRLLFDPIYSEEDPP